MESAFSANLIFSLPLSVPHLISLCALGSISQHGCSRIRTSAFGLTLGLGIIRFCNLPGSAPMSNVRLCFLFGSSLLELGSPKYGLYNTHSTLTSHPEAWACKQVAVWSSTLICVLKFQWRVYFKNRFWGSGQMVAKTSFSSFQQNVKAVCRLAISNLRAQEACWGSLIKIPFPRLHPYGFQFSTCWVRGTQLWKHFCILVTGVTAKIFHDLLCRRSAEHTSNTGHKENWESWTCSHLFLTP